MKSERRHELDTNVLAIRLNEWIEKIKPYSRILSVLVIVIIGAVVVSTYIARSATADRERAWEEYTYALTSDPTQVESLQLAAQDHVGTPMETWSNLIWADYQIASASGRFFRNRAEADQQIQSALAIYESLADNVASELLRDRAKLGLARALELKGELEKAREMYEQVGGAFALIAKARSMALAEQPDAEATFAWLATAVASARPRLPEGSGVPGEKPLFETDFSPTPQGEPAPSESAPATESTQPAPDADPAEESPIDFSFGEPEPAAEPAADTPDAPDEKDE